MSKVLSKVNDARQQIFTKRSRILGNIPATEAALMKQHDERYIPCLVYMDRVIMDPITGETTFCCLIQANWVGKKQLNSNHASTASVATWVERGTLGS